MTNHPPATRTDAQAIIASLDEPSCFVDVFERHFPRVHRFVAARVGDSDADDVTSEVFLVAFRTRGSYLSQYPDALPWLLGITTNVVRNHQRGRRRLRGMLGRLVPDSAPDLTGDADARVDAHSARATLNRALAALRPEERDVFLLAAWGELEYDQIARALDIPVGTVRSRLSRSRAALRATLGEAVAAPSAPDIPRPKEGS